MCFWCGSGSVLLLFWLPKWSPNRPQIGKSQWKTACRRQLHVLIDFWWFLSPKLDAPNPKIIEILLCFIAFKRLRPFRVHVRLGVHFCPTLAPFLHQKCFKIQQKGDKNNNRNFNWFVHQLFWSLFWSILHQIWCQNGAQCEPKSKPKRTWTRKGLNRLNAIKRISF